MRRVHSIRDLPDDLQVVVNNTTDSASSLLCPVCHGGRTGEHSLRIAREGEGAHLKCYRAGCGWYAFVLLDGRTAPAVTGPAKYDPKVYHGELQLPSGPMRRFFADSFGIDCNTLRTWAREARPERNAYFFCRDRYGAERGGQLRKYGAFTGPKAITYKHTDEPFIGWYPAPSTPFIVIVEDAVSAMKLWQMGYTAVCLFGTNLSEDKCREIAGVQAELPMAIPAPRLALDPDAYSLAIKYVRRRAGILNMVPVLLPADPKDMNEAPLREALQ